MKKITLLLITIFSLIFISCPENGYGTDSITTTCSSTNVKINEPITLDSKVFSWNVQFKDMYINYFCLPENYSVLKGKFEGKTETPEWIADIKWINGCNSEDLTYYLDKTYIYVSHEKVKNHYEASVSFSFSETGIYKILVGFCGYEGQEFIITVKE